MLAIFKYLDILEIIFSLEHIFLLKGGAFMAEWWIISMGFIFCLGLVGGGFVYVLKKALNSKDATTIDPLPSEENES